MMNKQNEIIERLGNEANMERAHYERMLELELAKPEEEMDVRLVEELLDALGAEEPAEGTKEIVWASIERKLHDEKKSRRNLLFRRIAACAAVFVVLSLATLGTARAFNWTFLLKMLAPVEETFGIHSANNPEGEATVDPSIYTVEDTEFVQIQYALAEEFPDEWEGFRVEPVWMPERYSFIDGSLYDDGEVAVLSCAYMDGEDFFNMTTTFFSNEETVSSYEYERTLEIPYIDEIAGKPVTVYRNEDESRLSASWIDGNAHYFVVGNLTEDELIEVISGLMGA